MDPGILGLQETYLWDSFDPPYYKRFADSLGMEYYYYPERAEVEWNGICIYSKFPIESTDFILHQLCVPNQLWNRTCMVKALQNSLKNDFNPNTILMGDMNYFGYDDGEYYIRLLSDAGLYYLNSQNQTTIPLNLDQIYASKKLFDKSMVFDYDNIDKIFNPTTQQLLSEASDHYPLIAHFGFE